MAPEGDDCISIASLRGVSTTAVDFGGWRSGPTRNSVAASTAAASTVHAASAWCAASSGCATSPGAAASVGWAAAAAAIVGNASTGNSTTSNGSAAAGSSCSSGAFERGTSACGDRTWRIGDPSACISKTEHRAVHRQLGLEKPRASEPDSTVGCSAAAAPADDWTRSCCCGCGLRWASRAGCTGAPTSAAAYLRAVGAASAAAGVGDATATASDAVASGAGVSGFDISQHSCNRSAVGTAAVKSVGRPAGAPR